MFRTSFGDTHGKQLQQLLVSMQGGVGFCGIQGNGFRTGMSALGSFHICMSKLFLSFSGVEDRTDG